MCRNPPITRLDLGPTSHRARPCRHFSSTRGCGIGLLEGWVVRHITYGQSGCQNEHVAPYSSLTYHRAYGHRRLERESATPRFAFRSASAELVGKQFPLGSELKRS